MRSLNLCCKIGGYALLLSLGFSTFLPLGKCLVLLCFLSQFNSLHIFLYVFFHYWGPFFLQLNICSNDLNIAFILWRLIIIATFADIFYSQRAFRLEVSFDSFLLVVEPLHTVLPIQADGSRILSHLSLYSGAQIPFGISLLFKATYFLFAEAVFAL